MNLLEKVQNGEFEEVGLKTLDLKEETKTYKTYKIPLEYLRYNEKNDRIASFVYDYINDENRSIDDITQDEFEGFIYESSKKENDKTMKNIKATRQRESAIVMSNGIVIDGNRRFTCLRKLHKEDLENEKFKYLIASVIDETKYDDKDIKRLELQIQNLEEKVGYKPIERYVGVYNNLIADGHKFTVSEYATYKNQTEAKVKDDIIMAEIMVEYLEFINQPLKFGTAREQKLDGTLAEIKRIVKAQGVDDDLKKLIKETCFSEFTTGADSKKVRKVLDACKNEDVFDQEKIDHAKDINNDVYKSYHEDGFLNPEVKQTMATFGEDLIEEASLSKEQNKEEKLVAQALKDIKRVDRDNVLHMSKEFRNSFDERLVELKKELDDLVGFANVEG